MRVARPWALELEYTRDMMFPLLLRPPLRWPMSVLLIGLGAASLPKFLYRHRPQAALTVVEIEAEVVDAAAQYFRLPEDPRRFAIEIGDGHDYVAATQRRFDLIVVDGYDAKCRVGMLDTLPFYCGCARAPDRRGTPGDELPQSPPRPRGEHEAIGRRLRRRGSARCRRARRATSSRWRPRARRSMCRSRSEGGRARAQTRHRDSTCSRWWRESPACRRACRIASCFDAAPLRAERALRPAAGLRPIRAGRGAARRADRGRGTGGRPPREAAFRRTSRHSA